MNIVKVSRAHRKLIVPPIPGALSFFPDAPKLPDGNLLIDHGFRERLLLKHIGFDVPNPMLLYYDWCGGKPFAVQRATCKLMTEHPRCYVLNHMGTGKTKTVLWAWDAMEKAGACGKMLVIAPLSTLNFVWAREVFSTIPRRKVIVLHGTKQERLNKLAQPADVYIINHDGLKVIESELQSRADIDVLCIDELAVYRNNSGRSKSMRKFAKRFQFVWGLTGAPMPNEPTDVWGQCQIITPTTVPKSQKATREMLMLRVSNYVWKPKPDAVDVAFRMMQPSVRYALDDVVELPSLITRPVDVQLSSEQKKVYDRVRTAMFAMVKNKQITAVNAGVAMGKLLQIAGGWIYTKNPEFVRLDPSPRIVALVDIINSAPHKVIVFIPYRHMIDGISKIFSMKGVDIDHGVVHGDTKNREGIFTMFQQTDKMQVLLAHPGTLSHGLTLTAADTVAWYLPITSLETYEQANARIRRVGQQHKQQVLQLQATPIERKIYSMLRSKQKVQDAFLALLEEASELLDPATA